MPFCETACWIKKSKKGLINIKNNDQECFLWCHVRHLNQEKIYPERITKTDKEFVNNINYDGVEFPVREKDFSKIETKKKICINVYCYEKKLTFPIYISDQKFKNSIDLLLLADENKSHYVYIKNFDRLCFSKRRIKPENSFEKVVYSVLVVKMCCQSIKKFAWALMVHNL